ncbi:MAG: hypothetical protein FWC41_08815 [Firmicutes bacterium]|nr:hypothetical protein [Bacillota bacterium]
MVGINQETMNQTHKPTNKTIVVVDPTSDTWILLTEKSSNQNPTELKIKELTDEWRERLGNDVRFSIKLFENHDLSDDWEAYKLDVNWDDVNWDDICCDEM